MESYKEAIKHLAGYHRTALEVEDMEKYQERCTYLAGMINVIRFVYGKKLREVISDMNDAIAELVRL